MTACTTMPSVAVPASSAIIAGVHASTATSEPKSRMNTRKPAIETTLFTIGAQVNGPKTRRAFSASPTSA